MNKKPIVITVNIFNTTVDNLTILDDSKMRAFDTKRSFNIALDEIDAIVMVEKNGNYSVLVKCSNTVVGVKYVYKCVLECRTKKDAIEIENRITTKRKTHCDLI